MTTTRALCPLNCGWYHDQHDPVQPQVVEAALRAHLETHTLEQWVVALHAARTDTARVRAKALREAADHFVAHCFTHTPDLHHGYAQCHCGAADELRALAKEEP